MKRIKELLYQRCIEHVQTRQETVEKTIRSNRNSLESETKSSAGDKHETGRAMLQLEMEKAGQQLGIIRQMKEVLAKINISKSSKVVSLGTLVETNLGSYFISVSAGQIEIEDKVYFAISTSSPIGKVLLGKKVEDEFVWNGKRIIIEKIT